MCNILYARHLSRLYDFHTEVAESCRRIALSDPDTRIGMRLSAEGTGAQRTGRGRSAAKWSRALRPWLSRPRPQMSVFWHYSLGEGRYTLRIH